MKLGNRKCKNCGKEFEKIRSLQSVCSFECSIEQAHFLEWQKRKKKIKNSLKTYSQKVNEARLIFQKWIRERDTYEPCISCGTVHNSLWDAGHYLKAELYSGLIFDENNVHKQCRKCNRYLNGNEINYRIGLIDRIGEAKVKELERVKDQKRQHKYTDEFLSDIKQKYKK